MKIKVSPLVLELKNPFALSTGTSTTRTNLLVEVYDQGCIGYGEAALPPYYPYTYAQIEEEIKSLDNFLNFSKLSSPAICALDMALLDLKGKKAKKNVSEILNLERKNLITSFTIALSDPQQMAKQARAANLSVLKVKVGGPNDLEIVKAIRSVSGAKIRLDVNGGWSFEQAKDIIPRLCEYDIELIEQPLQKNDYEGLAKLKKMVDVPLFVDEGFQGSVDFKKMNGCCDGVVIKLMKSGGMTSAIQQIGQASDLGYKTMISCMIESSLAVTAAAYLGGQCDYVDLDAPLLIKNDVFTGVQYQGEKIFLPTGLGLGVDRILS